MSGYVLSCEAGIDLAEIEDFTALYWGDEQAAHYIGALFAAFARIAATPGIGRRRADVPPPWLVYAMGRHLIVYRHNRAMQRVEILNILHPAMDIRARLEAALNRSKQLRD